MCHCIFVFGSCIFNFSNVNINFDFHNFFNIMIAQNINKPFNEETKHFDFILCDGNFCVKIRLLVRLN